MRVSSSMAPLAALAVAVACGMADPAAADTAAYEALLTRYVSKGPAGVNLVDYGRWQSTAPDRAALDGFIKEQQAEKPSALARDRRFAYWANLYNAITVKVILDHYPVTSIRDIKSEGVWLDTKAFTGPWVAKRVTVEGRELSLDDIEHKILRPTFKDPRVHYSVNCASIGCPNLRPKAWHAETLEADLDAAARDYVNHPRGASVGSDGALTVSSIYSWFKVDFGGTDAGVIAHLKQYAEPALAEKLKQMPTIAADRYDWGINDTAGKKTGN